MIKFFRKIRQKLLSENKFSKYLIYAIGEIVLVVIGILIALKINSWNQEKKDEDLRLYYLKAIKLDLENDVATLEKYISRSDSNLKIDEDLSERLSSRHSNKDTLLKIARFELVPYFNPSNQLNYYALNEMVANGKINLLDKELSFRILKHNEEKSASSKMNELNFYRLADFCNSYNKKYPANTALNAINGQIMDSFWNEIDLNQLKVDLNSILTAKIEIVGGINWKRTDLLNKTKKLVQVIDSVIIEKELE